MEKLCPRCRKPTLKPATSISGWMTPELYICENCGYQGYLFLEKAESEHR